MDNVNSGELKAFHDADFTDGMTAERGLTRQLNWLVAVGTTLASIPLIVYWTKFSATPSLEHEKWAQFGDYFGGVLNPAISYLAFIALIITIRIQSKELALSTRELKSSADALRAQHQTAEHQRFESTFYQLLRLHNDIVQSLDVIEHIAGVGPQKRKGRDCFGVFVRNLKRYLDIIKPKRDLLQLEKAYNEFYRAYDDDLGHYFRLLYNVVKFVDRSTVPNKIFYTNLIRAQLSQQELTLLFYNCLTPWGYDKFKPLVEKYTLLKMLDRSDATCATLQDEYNQSAFIRPMSSSEKSF